MNRVSRLLGVAVLVLFAGCEAPGPSAPAAAPPVTYREVAQRYNRNLANLDRIWSRATVEVMWRDRDGRSRYEQGDSSQLLVHLPDRLALSIGKAANSFYWVGCNTERYWFIDLTDENTAYIGRNDRLAGQSIQGVPLAVRPADLPLLLGLIPLDPLPAEPHPEVRRVGGRYVIELPRRRARLTIDPQTAMPVLIELLDVQRQPRVRAELSEPGTVRSAGLSQGDWPRIMTRVVVSVPGTQGKSDRLRLHLSDMTTARGAGESTKARAFDRVFDLGLMLNALNVKLVVDMDEDAAERR